MTEPQASENEKKQDKGLLSQLLNAWKSLLATRGGIVGLGFVVALVFGVMIAKGLEWSQVTRAFTDAQWLPWLPLRSVPISSVCF